MIIQDAIEISKIQKVGNFFFGFSQQPPFAGLISQDGITWQYIDTITPLLPTDYTIVGAWEYAGDTYLIARQLAQGDAKCMIFSDTVTPGQFAPVTGNTINFYGGNYNIFRFNEKIRFFVRDGNIFAEADSPSFENFGTVAPYYPISEEATVIRTPTGYMRIDLFGGVYQSTTAAPNTWTRSANSSDIQYIQDLLSDPNVNSLEIQDAIFLNGAVNLILRYYDYSIGFNYIYKQVTTVNGFTTSAIGTPTQNFIRLPEVYNPATQLYVRASNGWGNSGLREFETSTDGVTWTALGATTGSPTGSFGNIFLHDGVYYFTSGSFSGNRVLFRTTDLINSTQVLSGGVDSVAFNGTTYVALMSNKTTTYTSSDGITWNFQTPGSIPVTNFNTSPIFSSGSEFRLLTGNRLIVSTDGLVWTARTQLPDLSEQSGGQENVQKLMYQFDGLSLLKAYSFSPPKNGVHIQYSLDGGNTWLPDSSVLLGSTAIGSGDIALSVSGTGTIVRRFTSQQVNSSDVTKYTYSTDFGNTWNVGSIGITPPDDPMFAGIFQHIIYDGSRFLFALTTAPEGSSQYLTSIYQSTDLQNWTQVLAPTQIYAAYPSDMRFFAIPSGGYLITYAVNTDIGASTKLLYSTDLQYWEERYLQTDNANAENWTLVAANGLNPDSKFLIGDTATANVRLTDIAVDFENSKVVIYSSQFQLKPGSFRYFQSNLFTYSEKPIAQPAGEVSNWIMRGTTFTPLVDEVATAVFGSNDFFGIKTAYRQQTMQVNAPTTVKYVFQPVGSRRHRFSLRQGQTQAPQSYLNWINNPGWDIDIVAPVSGTPTYTITPTGQFTALQPETQGTISVDLFGIGLDQFIIEIRFTGPQLLIDPGFETSRRMRYFSLTLLDDNGDNPPTDTVTPIIKIGYTSMTYGRFFGEQYVVRSGDMSLYSAPCDQISTGTNNGENLQPLYNLFAYSEEFDYVEEIFDNEAAFVTHYYWSAREFSENAPTQLNIGPSSSQLNSQVWTAYPMIPVGNATARHALYRQERMLLDGTPYATVYFDLRPLNRNTFKLSIESADDSNVPNAGWNFLVNIPYIQDQNPGNLPSITVSNNAAYDALDVSDKGTLLSYSIREIEQHSPGQTPWYRVSITFQQPYIPFTLYGGDLFRKSANVRFTLTLLEPSGQDFVELFDATTPQPAHIELLRSQLEYGDIEYAYQRHYSLYDYDFVQDPCVRQ